MVNPERPLAIADLVTLLEIVGDQREFLREDGVDLARRVGRRLEEDVGAIGVRQEDLVRAIEQIAQALAVAVAVLDVLEHRPRRILAGGRLPIERIARARVLPGQIPDRVPRAAVLDLDQRDAVERQLIQRPDGVGDVLSRRGLETTRRALGFAGQDAPQLPVREDEVPFEHHELLEPAPVDARVEHTPALDRARPHEHHRRRERPVDRGWRRETSLTAPRTGIDVDRRHLHALNHHQPFAIVVRTRLHARIRPIGHPSSRD